MPDEVKAGAIVWDLAASTKLWSQGLSAAGAALGQFASVVRSTNFLMIAGWAAVGIAAFKAARKAVSAVVGIDSALREVATLLPETAEQLGILRRELIALSTQVPQPPELLTQATYQAISAGFTDLSDALQIVGAGAKAAVAGLTDTETAVDVITTALNAYQLSASEAGRVSDVFFKTVEQGKIRFGELAQNFGTTATSAALAGVSLEEVNAAIATLTKFGINASEATTSLNRAILSIIKPTKAQTEAAAKYGVELNATALETKGFTGVLRDLEDATQGNVEALAEIFPNIRAARSVFVLAGNGADEYRRILVEVGNSAGATQDAFEDMAGSLQNQRALLANNINALWASLGAKLLPAVLEITKALNVAFESQTETLRRLAEEQGDYARATELATQAQKERLEAELENLKQTFRIIQESARLANPFAQDPLLADRLGGPLAEILTQTFDLADGWDSVEDQIQSAIVAADEQRRILEETNRLSPDLEESIRNRVSLYNQLLGIAQAFLFNEEELADVANLTPAERRVERAEARLRAVQEYARADSEVLKRARETLRVAKAQEAIEDATNDILFLRQQLRIREVDASRFTVETAQEELDSLTDALAVRNATVTVEGEQERKARELLELELQLVDALIRRKQAQASLNTVAAAAPSAETPTNLVEAVQRLARLGVDPGFENLVERFPELADAVDTLDLKALGAAQNVERTLEFLTLAADSLEEFRDAGLELPEGVELVDEAAANASISLGKLKQRLTAIAQSTGTVEEKALAVEGALQDWGGELEDLNPLMRAFVESFIDLGGEIDADTKKLLDMIDKISIAVNSALSLAATFGLSNQEVNTLIRNLDLVARSASNIVENLAKNLAAGFGNILGLAAGGVGVLATLGGLIFGGGGPSPEEVKRAKTIKENTEALKRLKDSVDRQIAALSDLRSADFGAVAKALEVFDPQRTFAEITKNILFGGDIKNLPDALRKLGLDLDALERAAAAVGVELPLDDLALFVDGLEKTAAALRELDLSILRETYEGVREWGQLVADVFDQTLTPGDELGILQDAVRKAIPDLDALIKLKNTPDEALDFWGQVAKKVSPEFYKALLGDPNNAETVQAWEDFSRFLVENFDDLFSSGFFGGLNRDEAIALIRDIDQATDALQESVESDSGLRAISAQNKITTEQADIMIALDQTRNFYLMQIRDNTALILGSISGSEGLVPPSLDQVKRFTDTQAGTLIQRMEVTIEVNESDDPQASVAAAFDELDRRFGSQLLQRTRGTGAAPRRNN
jgi:TP901 family phage tail tape measure protein